MLTFKNISLQRDTTLLLDDVNLNIKVGLKVGVIGANGSGKSSLFSAMRGILGFEQGEVEYPKSWRIGYLQQELPATDDTALEYVLDGFPGYTEIQAKIKRAEADNDGDAIAHWYHEFSEIDGYRAESEAAKILIGLGFSQTELTQAVKDFSGGWRMRLNLAQTLISPADLLLLDEPTNHLDLDAIVWFEQWLNQWQGTLLLISHDRDFLDNVVNSIAHLYHQKIKLFTGDYTSFEKQWAQQLELEQKMLAKHQRKRAHLQAFVDRFRYKASKAKQAQSRVKMLEKMQDVAITKVNSPFTFEFEESVNCPNPIMTLDHVNLGYGDKTILENVNCQINAEQRVALLGPNGAGKSTLVKYLAGQLTEFSGSKQEHKNCRIGYFAQHQLEQLDADKTPITFFKKCFPALEERYLRSYLGGFGFSQEKALTKINNLSGGEKSRLVLALLVKQNPNFLLLDEPTNHLDLMMREALAEALQSYTGSLVLISHDRYLIRAVCDDLWLVADGKAAPYKGDTDDYLKWLINYIQAKQQPKKVSAKKVDAQQALKKQLQDLEKKMAKVTQELSAVSTELADPKLYEDASTSQLLQFTQRREQLQSKQQLLENEWYELSQQLDVGDGDES